MASSAVAIKVVLYFKQDLTPVFQKYDIEYSNEPSWVLEIHGLHDDDVLTVLTKYDRLRRSRSLQVSPLIDFEPGTESQFHDVSPFFDTLVDLLGFKADKGNPVANTNGMTAGDTREWTFTKVNAS